MTSNPILDVELTAVGTGELGFCVFETVCGHDPWYLMLKLFGPSGNGSRKKGQSGSRKVGQLIRG